MYDLNEYLSLDALSATLSLPRQYLKRLAVGGKIPFLLVGSRMRFNLVSVKESLTQLAAGNLGVEEKGAKRAGKVAV